MFLTAQFRKYSFGDMCKVTRALVYLLTSIFSSSFSIAFKYSHNIWVCVMQQWLVSQFQIISIFYRCFEYTLAIKFMKFPCLYVTRFLWKTISNRSYWFILVNDFISKSRNCCSCSALRGGQILLTTGLVYPVGYSIILCVLKITI